MKKILLAAFFYLFFTGAVWAKETNVLIINQIRGDEVCCQAGSLDLLNEIRDKKLINELSFGWALRYDVLIDKEYLKSLRDLGEFGLLLEVTPNLAKASDVVYKGKEDGSDWYYGKNAFLIGYTPSERKKLIDTLFTSFKSEFGFYPVFTVSWMIDSWSLSYINKTYNVRLHEITKEQYETDSYTLYGGIFNAPYYPNKLHPLLPGFGEDKLNLIIVRQTVSDLLQNYGSSKAYFTSQPNDYLENPASTDITYFKNLLENSITQESEFNFIMLGFENSLPWDKYANEYLKQLDFVLNLQKQQRIKVKAPTDIFFDFTENNQENKPFYLTQGFDSKNEKGVLWYFGSTYRARVILKENRLIITDLRNYSIIEDPYLNTPAKLNYAYQVIPYLFDASSQYRLSKTRESELKKMGINLGSTLSDFLTDPFGLIVGEGSFILDKKPQSIKIVFVGIKKGAVEFLPEDIRIDRSLKPKVNDPKAVDLNEIKSNNQLEVYKLNKHFDFFIKNTGGNLQSGYIGQNGAVALFGITNLKDKFIFNPLDLNDISGIIPIIQPDNSTVPVSAQTSIYYWNNRQAVAGRNPVRLFVLPLNYLGRPAKVEKIELTFSDNRNLKVDYPSDYAYKITPWFIDIWADKEAKTIMNLEVNGVNVIKDTRIEFVSDCSEKLVKCLTSWKQAIKYVLLKLTEYKLRFIQ